MYPIAWAVVEGENRSSWTWFLDNIRDHLDMADGTGWSIISDQQKTCIEALVDILPFVEHRKCARHVSANWKIKHKSWLQCSKCRLPGHNARTCPMLKGVQVC
ncbi:hypothetical protein LINPERHAP2_LOCUS6745 [Linum perenne]